MIVWGGDTNANLLGDGAIFDPASETWRPMSDVVAPAPRYRAAAFWTGREMVLWGGVDRGGRLDDGGRYRP